MDLWTEDIEEMRAEAREVIEAGFAAIVEAYGDPPFPPEDPLERARQSRERFARTYAPVPEARERTIAGVPCRVFVPEGPARAVYLHFHGGGMILGAPEMNDAGNRDLARRLGLAVVSVDYRLAPEHPYPAGPDDGVAVASWLLDHASTEFGSNRLLLGGESAGGYMAAAIALRVRDELGAGDRMAGINLTFGVYDWSLSPSQRGMRATDGPDMLSPPEIAFFTECYLPGRTSEERRDPSISPAFADLHGLPPAFFSVGTSDHLLDDTLLLATRWRAAGSRISLFVAPDMPHGFQAFPCGITRAWAAQLDAWFAEMIGVPAAAH